MTADDRVGSTRVSGGSLSDPDSSVLSLPEPERAHGPSSDSSRTPPPTTGIEAAAQQQEQPPPQTSDDDDSSSPNSYAKGYGATASDEKDGDALERLPSAATTIDFPEGGITGWLVVFGSFCAMLSLFGLINSAAVFESYFSTNQLVENTPPEIGWIFSLYLFIVFFVGIQVGPIFDRFGARVLVAVGSLLIVLSLVLLSWCDGRCLPVVASRVTLFS